MIHRILPILLLLASQLFGTAGVSGQEVQRRPILKEGEELLWNTGFEEGTGGLPTGWYLRSQPGGMSIEWGDFGIDGSKGIRMHRSEESVPTGFANQLTEFEPGETIEFTAWIKLTEFEGLCTVWARCDSEEGPERRVGGFQNGYGAGYQIGGTTIWSPITVRVTPSEETVRVIVGIQVTGSGTVQIDELHAIVRGAAADVQSESGPGLYIAEGWYNVTADEDTERLKVCFPVPILWRDQVPLSFRVWTQPDGHIEAAKIVRRRNGFHVAEVVLGDIRKDEDFKFRWETYVLVRPHVPREIPPGIGLPLADVPPEMSQWLDASWCCDSGHPDIQRIVGEVASEARTADVFIPRLLDRMRTIFQQVEGRVTNLTAVEALTGRGSCTSCANLGAAMLRAAGIPARIIAGYPTWSDALQTHYVVEYWLPEIGWRVMESTLCRDDRPGYEQIEVAMVLPEDELEEVARLRPGVAGGVPYLSLTEYPEVRDWQNMAVRMIGDMPGKEDCDHRARLLTVFDASPEEWANVFPGFSSRWQELTDRALLSHDALSMLALPEGIDSVLSLEALVKMMIVDRAAANLAISDSRFR